MTPERWEQIREVLEKALELAPGERSAFLNRACSSDQSLRREVETLLASSDDVRSNFLQSSAPRVTLMSGTRLGEYEVKSLLGSGGMGEVYRARDARLGRDVAIKVLPSSLSSDTDRLRRFEQEARAAAALNHPNILAVFQMGTYEGAPYLVSELLEGETLREQIKRGRLSIRKAIDYAVQIARGLAAAHDKGIVHRDLKPENLFVTKDGRVKILDFGLAKLTQPQLDSAHAAATLTEGTEPGVVMGTVGYMAPEQVRGQTADHRADVFAFGAILYEMLAGKRAFQKPTSPETMSAILNEDPPGISQVTANIPPALQRVVHRCLEKNPEQRFQSASDLPFALDALSESSDYGSARVASAPKRQVRLRWIVVGISGVVLMAAFGLWRRREARTLEPRSKEKIALRQLTANSGEDPVMAAVISPDGKYLAYCDKRGGLFLRSIDSGENRVLSSGPDVIAPTSWFPDGTQFLAVKYQDHYSLWRVSALTGIQHKIRDEVDSAKPAPDGLHIAYLNRPFPSHELWVIGLDGQELHEVVHTDPTEYIWDFSWSPTGQQIAYIVTRRGPDGKVDTRIESRDSEGKQQPSVLLSKHELVGNQMEETGLRWLEDGRLIYALSELPPNEKDSNLWAIRLDPAGSMVHGSPERLTDWSGFSVSNFSASADGKRLVFAKIRTQTNISIARLTTGGAFSPEKPQRLTEGGWENWPDAWTHDSQAVYFESNRSGRWGIYRQDVRLQTPESVVLGSQDFFDAELSPDGSSLLYTAADAAQRQRVGAWRLMRMPTEGGSSSQLTSGGYSGHQCAPRPSDLCVVSWKIKEHVVISSLDLDRGRGAELMRFTLGGETYFWSLSPDGHYVAFAEYNDKGLVRIGNLTDSTIRSLATGKWTSLQGISWSADGKSLYLTSFQPSQITLLSVGLDGTIKILFQTGRTWLGQIRPAPNGRMLAFSELDVDANAAMIDNF